MVADRWFRAILSQPLSASPCRGSKGRFRTMATRLGPGWLNRVQQLAGPTHAGRLGRFAVMAERVNALELSLERCSDQELKSKAQALRLRARQGDSLNSLM